MITFLKILFWAILASMLAVTVNASLDQSVFEAGRALWPDPWFKATLADAYFGFITFFIWVAYKQRTMISRILWFLFIMSFGNIAMSIYMLVKLHKLPADATLENFLLKEKRS